MLILLSFTEAAERLGIHPDECFELVQNGQLTPIRVDPNWYIDERAVEELRRKRQAPTPTDPYAIANQFLYPRTRAYASLTNKEFSDLLSEISSLPLCDTAEKRAQLESSRLLASLPLLANAIGRTLVGEPADDRRSLHTQRLRGLWSACERVAGPGLDGRGFAAFLISASKGMSDDPTLLVDIAMAAQNHGRVPGDFVWKDPTEMESNLVESARYAIRNQDLAFLKRCIAASTLLGVRFQSGTWSLLAKHCGEVPAPDSLECVWSSSAPSHSSFGVREWRALINAAVECDNVGLARSIFLEWEANGLIGANALLGVMAQAFKDLGDGGLLSEVLDLGAKAKELSSATWGSLFNAAGDLDDEGSSLYRLWTSCREQKASLDAGALGSLAAASGTAQRGDILTECWNSVVASEVELNAIAWGSFASAAGECSDAAILEKVFEAWSPTTDTLQRGEHGIWGSFFQAAATLKRADLLLSFFEKLESLVDHTVLRHRGTLDPLLWSLSAQLDDRVVGTRIQDMLSGAILDTEHCFDVLTSHSPAASWDSSGQFEGAARCLMRWLINQSYRSPEHFIEILDQFIDRLFQIRQDRTRLWHALISRSQESYVGCLRRRCLEHLGQSFSYLDSLTPTELVAELRKANSGVVARIVDFLQTGLAQVLPGTESQCTSLDDEQRKVVNYLVQNQRTFLQSHVREDPAAFFETTFSLVQSANLAAVSSSIARHFLFCLIREMSAAVWEELFEPFRKGVHSAKNTFIQQFSAVLNKDDLPAHFAEEVAANARRFLRDLGHALRESAPREAKAINVAFDVLVHLVGQRGRLPTTKINVPRPFCIAAWDGAKREIIIPLLKELRSNAETALRRLPSDQQFFEVSLGEASGEEEGYAVLTVANAWGGGGSASEYSTGIGLGAIQRWANRLEYKGKIGFAVPDQEIRTQQSFWVWRVYLHLPELEAESAL
ncbi:MAG: helix-turn-helix domain-containing protein [Acidobacteria bacterium]|nr:helix-turn-helix domain-containing protein [Acidobacteriota bacterium]